MIQSFAIDHRHLISILIVVDRRRLHVHVVLQNCEANGGNKDGSDSGCLFLKIEMNESHISLHLHVIASLCVSLVGLASFQCFIQRLFVNCSA